MAYKRSVYEEAKRRLDLRRMEAENAQEMRHSAAVMKCPEILDIENEMASYGAQVIKAVGMGADAKEFINNLSVKSIAAQDKRKALLRKNGFSEDYLDVKYTCPVCKDTGSHNSRYCTCYMNLSKEIALEELAKVAPVSDHTFINFRTEYYPDVLDKTLGISQKQHMQNIFDFCKAYAEDFSLKNKSIIMTGATGLGKTHLSLAIAQKAVEKGYNVLYGSAQNILDSLQKEHFSRVSPEDSIKDDVLDCDLLIIDDLGCEFSTQFTVAEIYNIVNTRILRSLPTIISTNLLLSSLEEKYSQRVTSRIIGSYYNLAFCGKDVRQVKNFK